MAATVQKPARLTLTTAIIVALAAIAGTVVYRTQGQPQLPDAYQQAFSDQLSNCGNDAECWKLEASRMQQVARYYQTHAKGLNDLYRQEQGQLQEMEAAFHKCAALLSSAKKD